MPVLDSVDIVEAVIAGFVILAASTLLAHLLDARERRQADRQRVRAVVVKSSVKFNGTLNAAVLGGQPLSPRALTRLAKLYGDTRNAYQRYRHRFSRRERRELDRMIDATEARFLKDGRFQ